MSRSDPVLLKAIAALGLLAVTNVFAAGDIGFDTYYCSTTDTGNGNLNELVFQGTKINYIESKTLADPTDVTDWRLCYIDGNLNSATCQEYGQGEFTIGDILDDKGCKNNSSNTCDDGIYSHPFAEYVSWPTSVTGSEGEIILFDDDPANEEAGVIDYLHYCLGTDCNGSELTILGSDGGDALGAGEDPSTDDMTCGNVVDIPYSKGDLQTGGAAVIARINDGTGEWVNSGDPDSPIYGTDSGSPGSTNTDIAEAALDHIRLLHDGQGLTCQAEPITLQACANSDCSEAYTEGVTVDFTSPTGGWTPDPITFSGGSATVELTHTTAETVTLDADAAADNTTRCFLGGGGETCELLFTDVGILIDGDDSDGTRESAVLTQIAGKPSDTGFNGRTQRVRVVRTDDETGACVAGAQAENQATFSYLVPNTDEGLSDNTVTVFGADTETLTASDSPVSVALDFDDNATAPFSFSSADAGRYTLRVAMELPVTDPDGNPTGETIHATDTTNAFVVRPLAVFADGVANPKAQDADGDVYKAAGEPFDMTFKGVAWTGSADDADHDGLWDACGLSGLSDPGSGYARVPEWNAGRPGPASRQPADGVNGDLSYGGDALFTAGSNQTTVTGVDYDEVGIFQLQRDDLNAFLGEAVEICSPYIGRFIPDHFVLGDGAITDRSEAACDPPPDFTYMDEPFSATFTLTAKNAAGETTRNYRDAFAKLGLLPGSFNTGAIDKAAPTPLSDRLTVDDVALDEDWDYLVEGQAEFTLEMTLARDTSPDGAFTDMTVGVAPRDDDGVELGSFDLDVDDDDTDDRGEVASTELRFGRLALYDAYGSELRDLPVRMRTEYFRGADDWFTANADDECTSSVALALAYPDPGDNLEDGETCVLDTGDPGGSGAGCKDAAAANKQFTSPPVEGDFNLWLKAPGDGNDGSVDVTATTIPEWLQYDWDDDGSFDDDPTGRATFGIYEGNQHHIYLREQY